MKGEKPTESTDEISAKDPLKVESVTEWSPITQSMKVRKFYTY